MNEFLHKLVTADTITITWDVMITRGILVFIFAIFLIKVGGKRTFGKQSAIDIILGITMGAILAKAITGNAPFLPALATCLGMGIFHRLLAMATLKFDLLARLIKGESDLLVKEGIMNRTEMKKTNVSEMDLYEALRLNGVDDVKKVKVAYLEKSGSISVVKADPGKPDEINQNQGQRKRNNSEEMEDMQR